MAHPIAAMEFKRDRPSPACRVPPSVAILLGGVVWLCADQATAHAADATVFPASGHIVVAELFTSQGCSSCPPAEELLNRFERVSASATTVIPLAYHVDYWDRLGWRDPFSQARWTQRQEQYARAFRLSSVYTPQLIVNGQQECVGSDERCARRAIAEAAAQAPQGQLTLSLDRSGLQQGPLRVTVAVERLPKQRGRAEVMLAVFENGLTTPVPRGENAGRTLRNDGVVRHLERALILDPSRDQRQEAVISIVLDPAWDAKQLGVAAFLQDPDSMRIENAVVQRVHPG